MTVASRAVAMAVMTEARAVDVEQDGHASHWVETVVWSGTIAAGKQNEAAGKQNEATVAAAWRHLRGA